MRVNALAAIVPLEVWSACRVLDLLQVGGDGQDKNAVGAGKPAPPYYWLGLGGAEN